MKKMMFGIATVIALALTGCSKNPAEDYVGTYDITSDINLEVSASSVSMSKTVSETVNDQITIALDGDDGDVTISGYYNTTGSVDKDGVLTIKASSITVHVSELPELVSQVLGVSELDAPVEVPQATAELKDGKMSWTSNVNYTVNYTVQSLGMTVPIDVKGTVGNVATAK